MIYVTEDFKVIYKSKDGVKVKLFVNTHLAKLLLVLLLALTLNF